jgi:hypothetical protein
MNKPRVIALCVIIAAALAVFGQVRDFQFVTKDDTVLLAQNPTVIAWTQASAAARLLTVEFGYAIPVSVASFAADWSVFDGRPAGFHLVNLLLHLLCAWLTFRILMRAVAPLPALCGALLFLLHPVQAESVAFITQRKDILSALFAFLALDRLLAVAAPGPSAGPGLQRSDAVIIVLCAALSCLSKPSTFLVGPTLALVYLLFSSGARTARGRALCVALCLCGALLLALNLYVSHLAKMSLDETPLSPARRAGLIGSTLRHYLTTLLWPARLAPKVPRPMAPDWGALAGFAALCVAWVVGLVAALRRGRRWAALSLLWVAGTYIPISNLVPVNRYVADCYLYAPMLAPCLGVALGVDLALRRLAALPKGLLGAALALCLGVLGWRCHAQVAIWRDEETLFAYLYRLFPENVNAMSEYAELLARTGRRAESLAMQIDFYQRALLAQPDSFKPRGWLVRLHLQRGAAAEGREEARRVLAETPAALRGQRAYIEAQLQLALASDDKVRALEAVQVLLRQDPGHPARALLPRLQGP